MQHIPLELLDGFIEELYDDSSMEGRTVLRSCTSVSKHFRHRTLKKNVQIIGTLKDTPGSARHMAKLRQLIVSPPNSSLRGVAAYIEGLSILWSHIIGCLDPQSFLKYKDIVAVLRELVRGADYAVRHLTLTVETESRGSK